MMSNDKDNDKNMRICMVGGQALMEGIMMRGEHGYAQVIRNPEGELVTEVEKLPATDVNKFFTLPVIRGSYRLIDSLRIGMKSLFKSAEIAGLEDENEKKSKFDLWLEKKLGDKSTEVIMAIALVLSLALTITLFFLLPNLIAGLIIGKGKSRILYNLIEGVIRIAIFLGYLIAVSKMNDIKRVFMYHGAEHKTIHCYEHNDPLTIENVRKYTTLHPRCGTAFLFVVMIISILVYSLLPRFDLFILNLLMRILFLPLVAGIAYEFNRFAGRSNGIVARVLRAPGLAMQYFTTKEPTDDMIEIAIIALIKALEIDEEVRNPDVSQPETIEQAPREELVL
ncbi:MAG: DUF1385 domain-containing protein [Clostridia bacterium]